MDHYIFARLHYSKLFILFRADRIRNSYTGPSGYYPWRRIFLPQKDASHIQGSGTVPYIRFAYVLCNSPVVILRDLLLC